MLTYLPLSNGTQANEDHFCPVQRCFEEFISRQHQLDVRRPTVQANLALKSERSARVTPGHLSSCAYYLEPASQHARFNSSSNCSAAATPTEGQRAPATRVTLLLPCKECERDKKCQKHNMSPPETIQTIQRRLKTNMEDSFSHITIHAVSRN